MRMRRLAASHQKNEHKFDSQSFFFKLTGHLFALHSQVGTPVPHVPSRYTRVTCCAYQDKSKSRTHLKVVNGREHLHRIRALYFENIQFFQPFSGEIFNSRAGEIPENIQSYIIVLFISILFF